MVLEGMLTTASMPAARPTEVVVGVTATGVFVVVGVTTAAALVLVVPWFPAFSLSTRTAVFEVAAAANGPLLQVEDIGSHVLACQVLQIVMYCQPTLY